MWTVRHLESYQVSKLNSVNMQMHKCIFGKNVTQKDNISLMRCSVGYLHSLTRKFLLWKAGDNTPRNRGSDQGEFPPPPVKKNPALLD